MTEMHDWGGAKIETERSVNDTPFYWVKIRESHGYSTSYENDAGQETWNTHWVGALWEVRKHEPVLTAHDQVPTGPSHYKLVGTIEYVTAPGVKWMRGKTVTNPRAGAYRVCIAGAAIWNKEGTFVCYDLCNAGERLVARWLEWQAKRAGERMTHELSKDRLIPELYVP